MRVMSPNFGAVGRQLLAHEREVARGHLDPARVGQLPRGMELVVEVGRVVAGVDPPASAEPPQR
jgi:hypothetical protein